MLFAIPKAGILENILEPARSYVQSLGHEVSDAKDPFEHPDIRRRMDVLVLTPRGACTKAQMAAAERLRAIIFPTIGIDPVEAEAATAAGIAIGHGAPLESIDSMADGTVGLILMLRCRLLEKRDTLREGRWREPPILGHMMRGSQAGIIGYGRIGRAVAERLRAFGVRCVFHDRALQDQGSVSLDELLCDSDIVSLHANRQPGAPPIIAERELSLMKPTSVLVNTARGGLVDEAAVSRFLQSGRLAGAAFDAFLHEPLPLDSELRSAPNAILTPHNAGHSHELMDGLKREFMINLNAVLDGDIPKTVFNPDVRPAWEARWKAIGAA